MQCPDGLAPPSDEAGFTLIEALVALTIMTLLAAVLLRGVVALRQDASDFADGTNRAIVARSILDDALRNRKLRDGTYSGTRGGWPWTLVAAPVDLGNQIGRTQDASGNQRDWRPQRLTVAVGTLSNPLLETLRLVAP